MWRLDYLLQKIIDSARGLGLLFLLGYLSWLSSSGLVCCQWALQWVPFERAFTLLCDGTSVLFLCFVFAMTLYY